MTPLETKRTRLEPLRVEHAGLMFEGLSNPRLYEFSAERPPANVDALRERYARLESRRSPGRDEQWLNWVVLAKPELRARGYVQASVARASASIAYVLFEGARGQGLAHEAVTAMLEQLRASYAVRTALATVDPRNQRSVRLLARLGFELSATPAGAEWTNGVLVDEAAYALQL